MLKEKELYKITGGGAGYFIAAGIIGVVSFFAGLLDGFTRPFKCRT